MKTYTRAKQLITHNVILVITTGLLSSPYYLWADTDKPSIQATSPLNLSLPKVYTTPPPAGVQYDLGITANIYQGSLDKVQSRKVHALGLQRIKIDKSLRMRGWELKDDLYFGQTRVGSNWGIGMMMTDGDFAYGLNNKGIGMTYSNEKTVYRINSQEVSMEIDF